MKNFFILLIVLFSFHSVFSQTLNKKPPLKPGKIVLESVASGATGVIAAYVGAFVVSGLDSDGNNGFDDIGKVVITMAIMYPFGTAGGAWLIGNTGNEKSSFVYSFLGSFTGMGAAIFMANIVDGQSDLILPIFLALPVAGAVLGHNIGRRYKNPPQNALLNFNKSGLEAGIPQISLQHDRGSKHQYNLQFQLLSYQF